MIIAPPPTGLRCLTIRQPFAEQIESGEKRIEFRSWSTDYRGDLLLTISKAHPPGGRRYPVGCTSCVVDLWKVTGGGDSFEWHFRNPRMPGPVRILCLGKLKLWRPSADLIALLDLDTSGRWTHKKGVSDDDEPELSAREREGLEAEEMGAAQRLKR